MGTYNEILKELEKIICNPSEISELDEDQSIHEFCKIFDKKNIIIRNGSSIKNKSRMSDVDFIVLIDGPQRPRRKVSSIINGILLDATIVQSNDFVGFLFGEARRGHYDVASCISNGIPKFISEEHVYIKLKNFSDNLLKLGPVELFDEKNMEILLRRLTKCLIGFLRCKKEHLFPRAMQGYPVIYSTFMLANGLWPCLGAYRQADAVIPIGQLKYAYEKAFQGDRDELIKIITRSIEVLGGLKFGIN